MKLNKVQTQGVLDILSYMEVSDVFSLARRLTENLIKLSSVDEAKETIILYEFDLRTFFSRKKVSRAVLFRYCYEKRIDVPVNKDKISLVNTLLQLWENQDHYTLPGNSKMPPSNCESLPGTWETPPRNHEMLVENLDTHSNYHRIPPESLETPPGNLEVQSGNCDTLNNSVGNVDILAESFVPWFYGMLNSCLTENSELRVEHFWNDCDFVLVMQSNLTCERKEIRRDSKNVFNVLMELQKQHNLFFNPNLTMNGVRGRIEPHGLVLVMACGTLHQVNKFVGVFQQIFGLIRDPFMQNNWKIKSSTLMLKSQEIATLPSLEQDCFNNLTLPQSTS